MSDEDLVRRWDASTGAAHVGAVRSWLQASGSVGFPEPFGRVGGRVDLRGLPLSAPVDLSLGSRGSAGARDPASYITIATLEFRRVGLARLDLRGALLSHVRFFSCPVEDCVFDDSVCLDWRLWATDVRGCSFVGTKLRSSSFGSWYEGRGNTFEGVDFTGADLRGLSMAVAATYVDTDFSYARLDGVTFRQPTLTRCTFRGRLKDVNFDGRMSRPEKRGDAFIDVDMSEAEFEGVDFARLKLSGVRLPDDPDVVRVTSIEDLGRAAAAIAGRDDVAARVVRGLIGDMKAELLAGYDVVVNLRDPGRTSAEAEVLVRQLLANVR